MTAAARRRRLAVLAVALSALLVSALNFNKGDLARALAGRARPADLLSIDETQYVAMVEHYRGVPPDVPLWAPFTYRPLAPWLASWLPFEPLTALNLLNVLSLLGATFFVWRTLALYEPSGAWQFAGTLAFVWSFPFFYYGTTGLVDPPALFLLAAGLYLLLTDRWWGFVTVGLLGGLTKESVALLWPVALARILTGPRRPPQAVAALGVFGGGFVATSILARTLAPSPGDYTFWKGVMLAENLARQRTYLAFALSLGLQGVFAMLAAPTLHRLTPAERRAYWPLIVGAAGSLALFSFALLTARPDGRFVWLAHPFLTPIAVLGAKNYLGGDR